MKIDNLPSVSDRQRTPRERAFGERVAAVRVIDRTTGYAALVQAYKELEEEFLSIDGSDGSDVLDMKRCLAARRLIAAYGHEQPMEVCRDNWNANLELGFSGIEDFCGQAITYADCCLFNRQYDVGLEVLDMVFAEVHRRLEEPSCTRLNEAFYDQALDLLEYRREEITAYKSSEEDGDAWNDRREAEAEAREEPSQQERRADQLICTLFDATRPIRTASAMRPYSELQSEYRKVEAEFVSRLDNRDDFFAPEVRRHVSAILFEEAHAHRESFDVCRQTWNELLQCGFSQRTDQCALTRTYAQCCLFNSEPEAGLAVVEPLLAELQTHIDQGTDTEMPRRRYPREISRLQKLRNDLQALKTNP